MNININNYPWLSPSWQAITGDGNSDGDRADSRDGLHHGLLINGAPGIAKREFAVALSQLLLCDAPSLNDNHRQACGQCRNCILFAAGTHPDFHALTSETETRDGRIALLAKYCDRYQDIAAREKRANPSRVIPVDQVRQLIERFSAHATIATRKVALIVPADRMNINAANALLKLLEEPPANSILILVSATPAYLPATVRSRCFQIGIPLPDPTVANQWLANEMSPKDATRALTLSNGGPVDALTLKNEGLLTLQDEFMQGITALANQKISAVELAAKFNKSANQHGFLPLLDWLHRYSCELIRKSCAANHTDPQRQARFNLYDKIATYRKIAREPLNEQLAMEVLMLQLQHTLQQK